MRISNNGWIWGATVAGGALIAARQILRRTRRIELAGKVAFVTGGSRGLGLILARNLRAMGAKVAICARDVDGLARAKADLDSRPGGTPVFTVSCDVTDADQIRAAVSAVAGELGTIDILINNAGVIQVGPMDTMTEADYENALDVHFWAPYHFVQAVLPGMRAARGGRIVNVASIGGKVSVPHLLPYSTSKFALVGYSDGLRAELARENIFVTTVCPGLIRTGSPRNASFKGQHRAEYTWFALGDALPGISYDADRAAREIVDALRHGDAQKIISLPAYAAAWAMGVAPGLVSDGMGIVAALLPQAGGIGTQSRTGAESETGITQSALTALSRHAENANNQK